MTTTACRASPTSSTTTTTALPCHPSLAWKPRLWPGFRRLGLGEIVSRAQSQKSGLAWLGFGPSWGFGIYMYNFALFDFEINVNTLNYLSYSVLQCNYLILFIFECRTCRIVQESCKIIVNHKNGGFDCYLNSDGSCHMWYVAVLECHIRFETQFRCVSI